MPFELSEVTADADFEELIRVEWLSYEQPYCRLIRLFFPILGADPDARATALEESIDRQLRWHKEDPTSRWIKVVDSENKRIAGAACWHVFEKNPYDVESEDECTWYPAGESRDLANSLMRQFLTPRMKYMAKPHVFLDICFVHPIYRRRGIGTLLMEWGIKIADERGLESYIDATEEGIPLYEKHKYTMAPRVDFMAEKIQASPAIQELQEELLPFSFWPMWRPIGGNVLPDIQKPWERKL